MEDMYCRNPRCREPWEAYYVMHDMTEEERRMFLAGKGCPSCSFGKPKNMLSRQAWASLVERLTSLLETEHNFIWIDRTGERELCVLNPSLRQPLNAMRALLLDHESIAHTLEKQKDATALQELVEQAAQVANVEMLRELRLQMLHCLQRLSLREESTEQVAQEEDDAALRQFLKGLEAWDEDPLDFLG